MRTSSGPRGRARSSFTAFSTTAPHLASAPATARSSARSRDGPLIQIARERCTMEVETRSPELLTWTGRDGILILDPECGCLLEVNPFLTELVGFSRETLRGRRIRELGFFGDRAQAEALFEMV